MNTSHISNPLSDLHVIRKMQVGLSLTPFQLACHCQFHLACTILYCIVQYMCNPIYGLKKSGIPAIKTACYSVPLCFHPSLPLPSLLSLPLPSLYSSSFPTHSPPSLLPTCTCSSAEHEAKPFSQYCRNLDYARNL